VPFEKYTVHDVLLFPGAGRRPEGHTSHIEPCPSRAAGTVALAEVRARWTASLGTVSGREGQLGERVGEAARRRYVSPEIVEALAEVLDEGMAGNDDPGGTISLQPARA